VVQRNCDGDRHRALSSSNRGKEGGGEEVGWDGIAGEEAREEKWAALGGKGKRTRLNRKVSDFITCFN
jgi:hypothetical protein